MSRMMNHQSGSSSCARCGVGILALVWSTNPGSACLLLVLPAGDYEPGHPARRAPACRRLKLGVYPAARDHPRNHRVRVPHVTRRELIATPHGSRDLRDQVEDTPRTIFVVGQSPGAIHCLGDIGNVSVEPKTDLVAEYPKSACPATADGASGNDAPLLPAQVWDRRLLDDEGPLRDFDLKRGVVEIARRTPLQPRRQRLVDATVKPDETPTGAERQPVQIDCGRRSTCRIASERVSAACPHTCEYRK